MGLLNAIISTPWFFWRQMFILKKFVFNLFFFFNFKNFLAVLHGMWDLSSPTRKGTSTTCGGSAGS